MGNLETIFKMIAQDFTSKTLDKIGKKFTSLDDKLKAHNKISKVAETTLKKYKDQVEKAATASSKIKEKTQKLSASAQTQNTLTKKMGITQKTFNGLMGESGLEIQKNGKIFDESTKKTLTQGQAISKLSDTQAKLNTMFGKSWSKEQTKRIQEYTRANKQMGVDASAVGNAVKKLGWYVGEGGHMHEISTGAKIKDDTANKKIVNSTKRFRMELLSVMFFGMAVQRFFGALTKGSLEASGAMNVWSTITMLMGLPVAMKLTKRLLSLLGWWGKLDKETKKNISTFLWLGFVLGTLMLLYGTIGLGIQGMTAATVGWIKLGTGIKWIITLLKTWSGSSLGVIAGWIIVIAAGVIGLIMIFKNWGKNATKIGQGIMYVLISIAGIFAIIAGAPALIVAGIVLLGIWLVKLLSKFQPVKDFFTWLGRVLSGIVEGIGSFFSGKGFKAGWAKGFATPSGEEAKEKSETKLAAGGIVRSPTRALIGEAGPEAVIPLNSGFSKENNIYYNPTIHINASISNDMDIENVAKKVNELLYSELRGVSIR